jgi:O-antigen chain-terminating methyltransferase
VAKPSVTDTDLQRLGDERRRADAQYNEALTRVDRALVHPEPLPAPPPPPEHEQLPRLNQIWEIVPANPIPFGGWRARLGALVWRMLAPIVQRQQEFNSALVDHLNRQHASEQQARETSAALIESVRREFDALARFQSELIQHLQQITPYVDTKDRQEIGVLRRQTEERTIALAAGLSGVSDELLRRWESTVVREQRLTTRFTSELARIAANQDEIQVTVGGFQRVSQALKRELERMAAAGTAPAPASSAAAPTGAAPPAGGVPGARPEALGTWLDSAKYVGFEESFRGSTEDISSRVLDYVPLFQGSSAVVDIGCGRGEFLELLATHGVTARGVDINHEMVERCRQKGLDVIEDDAVHYLETQADGSIGGLLAVQVVEHLQADHLVRLLELAYHKLRPGSRIALETINPACWYAFFASYIRDITHVHPIHPDTLRYLLIASGFQRVEIRYRAPFPERDKLQSIPVASLAKVAPGLAAVGETFNSNVVRLNSLLFTYLDYVAIAEKI